MKEIIDDLKDLSGVLGACLYHGQKGVLEANLPNIFREDKLLELGKLLMKIQSAGSMSFHDLTDLSLHYDESVILVRGMEENLILFLLCDPGFNQNLVSMSLNLLKQELENQQTFLTQEIPRNSNQTRTDEVLPFLAEMKKHLPKIMGPMADIVFDETVEDWRKQGKTTPEDLESLVHMLAEEIGNGEQISRFKEMIAPVLTQAVKGHST